jgi:hypothetical protein
MKLKNYTDIPDETVRAIIRAVRPSGISNFDVRVSNGRRFRGRAYHAGSGYHETADPFIVCAIPEREHLIVKPRGAYLGHAMGSRIEQLIVLLSHELRHLWQSKHTRGKVYGSKGRFSERDADAYALQMLRRYRRGELGL